MKFVIRRLNKSCYERQDGVHPARSALHSFFYLSEGTVLVEIGNTTYFVQSDDIIIIPAGQIFKVRYYENSKGYMGGFHVSCLDVGVGTGGEIAGFDFLKFWDNPKMMLGPQTSMRISTLLEWICSEYEKEGCVMELIGAYLRTILVEVNSLCKGNMQMLMHNDTLCNNFLEMLFHCNLEECCSEDMKVLSVTYFAEKLNITPNHLNKIVKGGTGKSPSVWIEELIIQRAKHLLRTTCLPLGEIASMIGLHDQSYFARRFKKHEGISPREYRNMLRQTK